MNKKMFSILAAIGILLTILPVVALADPIDDDLDSALDSEVNNMNMNKKQYRMSNEGYTGNKKQLRNENEYSYKYRYQDGTCLVGEKPASDIAKGKFIKVVGAWGYAGDNETDGCLAGRIIKNNKVHVFKGVFNTTSNETQGRVFGVMKHGYFNGRIVTPEGNNSRITGLYRIDKENNTIRMRWMTPRIQGWATVKILLSE